MLRTPPAPRLLAAVTSRLRLLLAIVAAVLGLAIGAQGASAADLYLAPTGVNTGTCQDQANPCSSVSYAQSQATATPEADTVHLAAGDYTPDTSFMTVPNVAWVGPQAGVPADEQTGPTARMQAPAGGFAFVVQADGNSFDGLTFQSSNYAASDASFGLYNLNPTTIRNSVFTHILTGIYAGSAITVSGVALDTANDAMYFTGTTGTISNTRFSPPPAYSGLINGANGPLTVTDSNFTGGTYGFLSYSGSSPVTLTGNRFSPSIPNGLYNDGSTVDATDNWWGCNTGPNTSGCATLVGPGAGTTTTAPYLRLGASVAPDPVDAGAPATVTGALDRNSAGDPVAVGFPGSNVTFATSYGTLDRSTAPLASGAATAIVTAPNAGGTADLTATLDNAVAHAPLVVSDVPPTITVDGDVTTARSGSVVALSGVGNPGSTIQVEVNELPVGLPITVAGDGTWSSSVTLVDGDNALRALQGPLVAEGPTVVGVYPPVVSAPQAGSSVPATVSVTGTGLAGASVDVADEDGTAIGSATVGSGGGFTVTTDPLALGAHSLHVTQTTDGVTSTETTVAVTVIPDAPVLTSPTNGATLATGVVHFVGTALPNADVTVTTTLGAPIASGNADASGDFDLPSPPIVPGTYSFVVVQASAGLTSAASAPITVTVTAPDPTIEVDRTDATTGETVHLSGTGDPGAVLQVRNSGTPVETATVATDGSWSADVTVADGTNDFDVVQYGTQTSPAVTVHGYSAPTIALPSPNAQVRPTFAIRGDGTTGSLLTVTDEHGTEIGRTTPTACGCWSLQTSVPLADGPHTLTISQTAGGTVRSTTLTVVVDPDALEVTAPIDRLPVRADGLRFTGSGAPGATISVYLDPDDATPVATGTAGPDGAFEIPVALAPGFADVAVTQTPVGGSESDPIELSLILLLNPPTIAVDGPTTVAEGDMISVSGTAEPDAHVVLYDNETAVTDVVADGNGAWNGSLPALAGDNAISVMQVVLGANQAVSDLSDPVNATGVGAPSVSAPLAGDHVQTRLAASGSALPGATVTIAEGTTVLGTATADATTGAWSTTTTTPLAYGDRTLDVRQQLDGATGPDRSVAVKVVPSAPVLTHPDGDELGDGSIPVAGTADPSADVDVFLDGASIAAASTTADPDGDFSVDVDAAPGTHAVRVSQHVGTSLSGPLSAPRSIDVLPPRPTLQLDSDPTTAAGDPISVSGHALPGATVLVDREAPAGTVMTFATTADAVSGDWSTTLPAASRTNTISARQQASAGRPSLPSQPPVVVTATPLLTPPAFTLPADARAGDLTVTGNARPGATVSGTFDGAAESTTADGDGDWSINVSVRAGEQTASFRQSAVVDGVTETSDDSAVQTLTGVAAPVVTAPVENATLAPSFTVTGTALPSASVTVSVDGLPLLPVTADVAGSFSVSVIDLEIGTRTVSVTQTHGAVTGDPTVVHVRVPPAAPTFDAPHGFVTGPVHLTGTALPDAAINVYDGNGATPVATGAADEDGDYDVVLTPATGTHQLTVTQTAAGLESAPSSSRTVTVWPVPLTVAADAEVVALGGTTTLSGNAMPGATVLVSAADSGDPVDSTTADATTGHWSATFTLPAGVNALEVVQELSGDRGEPVAGPTVTVLAAPTIDPLTSPVDTTPSLSGTAPPNVTVVVEDEDGHALGSTSSDGSGGWSLTTTALAPGDHTLTAHARLDGVDGPDSAGLAVSVRPAAPVMTSPSGVVATDGAIRFRGTAVPGATVTAYATDSGLPELLASGTANGAGAYDFSVYVAPAAYTVAVGQTVGTAPASVLSPTASVSVTLPAPTLTRSDATVRVGETFTVSGVAWPAATVRISVGGSEVESATAGSDGSWSAELTATAGDQTITAVQQRFATDSPAADAVHVFGLAPPTIATPTAAATVGQTFALSGSGDPGATITVRNAASASIGSGSVGGDGSWSVTTTTALVPGTRAVTVEQTRDGTTSATVTRSFEVQPPVPSLATPVDGDRGAGAVRFSGTALPNAIIDVHDGATTLAAVATADGSGAFSGSVPLAVGDHTVTVTQRVGTSIASEPTATRTVTVLPDAPTLAGPGEVTTGAAIALTGSARPNATIAVLRGGTPVATTPASVTADGDGDWTATVTAVDGDNVLTAKQTSAALESPASTALHVLGVGSAAVATPAAGARVGPTFTLTGTGVAGATVTARDAEDAVLGSATVGGSGGWALTTTAPLSPGSRTVTLTMRTAGGTTGAPPATRTFAVVPAAPTVTAASGPSPITVSGHALAGATVTVSEGATVVATGTAGAGGAFAIPVPLAPGDHELTVTQRAAEGGTSDPSAPVRVTVPTPGGPTAPTTPTEPTPTPTMPTAPAAPTPPVVPPPAPTPPNEPFGVASKTARETTVLLGLRLPTAGRLTVTATIQVRGKRTAYATTRTTVRGRSTARVVLRPSRKALEALAKRKAARITITVTFTPTGGTPMRKTTTVTVKVPGEVPHRGYPRSLAR